jgi:long-chain acyl-CoA synthetase
MVSYIDKPWVKHYDEGVPPSLAPYPEIPLYELLDNSVKKYPNNVACITSATVPVAGVQHTEMTYRELGEASDKFAAALAGLGVKKGDRVAIVMPNANQFVIAFFGILKAGGTVVALNPTFPPVKWADQLNDSAVEVIIALTPFYEGLNSIRAQTPVKHVIVTSIKEYLPGFAKFLFTVAREKKMGHRIEGDLRSGDFWFQDLLTKYSASQRPKVQIDPKTDTAIFQYTGGTTGVPKAARGPHSALVSNATQMQKWMAMNPDPSKERSLAAIPMFHVYGMVAVMALSVAMGSTMIMVPNARDIDNVLMNIDKFKPTMFMGVPALYNAINFHPDVIAGKYDLSSIRACISGSAPLAPETKRRFEELTGGTVMEGFGMSETPTSTHCNPLNGSNKVGSIGMPMPDVECRVVSLDDGVTDMPVGEPGELIVRGPVMMTGYHNMPTETANAIRDSWLYTGDIAYMDEDGYFFIVDRKKDMVLIGGFNVYPNNIEKTLMSHEAVAEAAVAGVPHPDKPGQEALKAWVVLKPEAEITSEALREWAATRLAPYEVPRRIDFVKELPKTAVGKILRRELVRMEAESAGQSATASPV